ncbi:MAG: hypothetical protein EAX95_11655 [Candidatus Thorarchaeota archaeon]|nr:hypothetical protein [Candidatus Thorarchaeota archaeon]
MTPDEKLSEEEKAELQKALRDAAVDDLEIQTMAQGLDESEPVTMPVESSDDLLSAAAMALEFVEGLEAPEARVSPLEEKDAVAGFDALLRKLETLRSDISSLQRGVVGVFAAQLLTFRGKVVELKSRISEEMVERLRMKFFKTFIESTFVDIVDNEFAALEKELVDKIVEQTQERFKEFAQRVRESELDLRSNIMEQQDIVRSFMQSLEEDGLSLQDKLSEKDREITRFEHEIKLLQERFDKARTTGATAEEMEKKLTDYTAQIEAFRDDLLKKEALLDVKTKEAEESKAEANEVRMKLGELQSQLEVYKAEKAVEKPASAKAEAEVKSLQSKVELLEKAVESKSMEMDQATGKIADLSRQLESRTKEKEAAEVESKARLDELTSMQDKIKGVKDLEQKIYDLEKELKTTQDRIPMLEMQQEAFQKATRLMEKERDIALERRDLSDERTKRYIHVLNMESSTKVLVLVDEVGSITLADLAKTLAQPVGLVTKWVRQLDKLGVLKLKGEKAYSTLKDLDIKEGEVDVTEKR